MLNPSMQDLMKRVNNRYLLVNLAAQRARDIALEAEEAQEKIPEKPVKIALDEIAEGKIVYQDGPKPEEIEMVALMEEEALEDAGLIENETASDDILEEL